MIRLLFLIISFSAHINSSEKIDVNEYIVKSGDTLWSISRDYGVSINNLIELNSFNNYKSGVPIINVNQIIKLSRSEKDNVSDYCYSSFTEDGVNFSKTLSKKEIYLDCVFLLNNKLDKYLIGDLDMSMSKEQIIDLGINVEWNESKNIPTDERFWDIYLNDNRYPYYFFNLQFLLNDINDVRRIQNLLYEAALKGDSLSADYILNSASNFYEILNHDNQSGKEFIEEILNSIDATSSYIHTLNPYYQSYWGIEQFLKPEKLDFEEHPRYLPVYLFRQSQTLYDEGNLEYYKVRDDALKFIRNSSSKLLSWYEVALVVNIMFHSMNLDDYETSLEISSILERRLEFIPNNEREIEIYNRYINNIYYDVEFANIDLILTWILNLTSSLDRVYPGEDIKKFIQRRDYFLEYVENALEEGLITDIYASYWYGDTGALIVDQYSKCTDAEEYFIKAFNIFDNLSQEDLPTDSYTERVTLVRCFINSKNILKAKEYLESAAINITKVNNPNTYFYDAFIDISRARIHFLEERYEKAFQLMQTSSLNIFSNIEKLSHTLDPTVVSEYILDYTDLYSMLDELGFDVGQLKNYFELQELKNKIVSNARLEMIKVNSAEKDMINLKNELDRNKKLIGNYEDLISEDFADLKNIAYLENLYSERTNIINKIYSNNKALDALFNPSYSDYLDITKNLDDESAIISYILADSGGIILLKTKTDNRIISIQDSMMSINSSIRKVRESIENTSKEFAFDSSNYLYMTLFEPLEEYLSGIKNIYLYGSELENLPFGILHTNYEQIKEIKNNTQKLISSEWLVEDFSFARIYPLSNKNINQNYDYKFLGLANPSSNKELNLPILKNSEDEITQIALSSQSFSKDFILSSNNASKKNLLNRLSNSYERLVFATHSVPPFWNGVTSEGALVLDDENGDYLLTSTEIVNLDIRSDIVVLSSCSTKEKGSDSIYKAFLVAGSNSVMFTNWDLETLSASLITDKVFKNILFNGDSKHEALRKASIDLMNDYSNPMYAHPAFWGNFSIAYRSL